MQRVEMRHSGDHVHRGDSHVQALVVQRLQKAVHVLRERNDVVQRRGQGVEHAHADSLAVVPHAHDQQAVQDLQYDLELLQGRVHRQHAAVQHRRAGHSRSDAHAGIAVVQVHDHGAVHDAQQRYRLVVLRHARVHSPPVPLHLREELRQGQQIQCEYELLLWLPLHPVHHHRVQLLLLLLLQKDTSLLLLLQQLGGAGAENRPPRAPSPGDRHGHGLPGRGRHAAAALDLGQPQLRVGLAPHLVDEHCVLLQLVGDVFAQLRLGVEPDRGHVLHEDLKAVHKIEREASAEGGVHDFVVYKSAHVDAAADHTA
mmetsp:Transcript_1198/g.2700  ORF Transcript_1198/g.2700 Transcript_1198/m.2700 type:complete len:313 (-) Transcript_1198:1281-2219(-)